MSWGVALRNGLSLGLGAIPGLRNGNRWDPSRLQTQLWLDAADAGTVTLNGATVSQINDKSGNGRNVTQATAANQPAWGRGRNLLTYSEDFTNASWVKNELTISAVSDFPPGVSAAFKMAETATNGFHINRQLFTFSGATSYTATVYVKAAERYIIQIAPFVGGVGGVDALFNAQTGAATSGTSTAWTINSVSMTSVGNGWYRGQLSFTTTTGGTGFLDLRLIQPPSANSYAGTAGWGILATGAQLNPGLTADAYQKTDGTAFTASTGINGVSALAFDGTNDHLVAPTLPSSISWTAGVTIASVFIYNTSSSWARICDFGNGAPGDNILFTRAGTTGFHQIQVFDGANLGPPAAAAAFSNSVANIGVGTIEAGSAISLQTGTYRMNGTAGTPTSIYVPRAIDRTINYLGRSNWVADTYLNGLIGEFIVCNSRLSSADVERLEGYLAWKWGTVSSLPSGHPYKNSPPLV